MHDCKWHREAANQAVFALSPLYGKSLVNNACIHSIRILPIDVRIEIIMVLTNVEEPHPFPALCPSILSWKWSWRNNGTRYLRCLYTLKPSELNLVHSVLTVLKVSGIVHIWSLFPTKHFLEVRRWTLKKFLTCRWRINDHQWRPRN